MVSRPVPLHLATDPAHGGRWTSLRAGGREWLWHRDEPRREHAGPGDAFADAGGLEECVPTVRGRPDHGDAWSRPWTTVQDGGTADGGSPGGAGGASGSDTGRGSGTDSGPGGGGTHMVECPDFRLTRTLSAVDGAVVADYQLTAAPGYRFVWAAHALLDVSPHGRLVLPDGAAGRLYPDGGAGWRPFRWPHADGAALDRLGPDDGTALGAVVDSAHAAVSDGLDRLAFALEADGQPVSVAVWRNLRGFPEGAPYRSVGVEPMLGRVFDVAEAAEEDAARVPASGEARWRLTVTAESG